MKYQNKQNGKVMEILKQDTQKGTMLIQFEDGKSTSITAGTFKRWYKKVEEPAVEAPEVVESLIDLDNPVTEEQAEQAEQAGMVTGDEALEMAVPEVEKVEVIKPATPAKPKKVKVPKKEANPEVEKIISYISHTVTELGGEVFTPDKAPKVRAFKIGGHMFCRINISKFSVNLCCRSKAIDKAPDKTQNHLFDAIFVISDLSKASTTLIDALIHQSFGYQKSKNTHKEDK